MIILTEEEDKKRLILIDFLEKASLIVKKYIAKFENDPEYKLVVEDLLMGAENLDGRIKLLNNNLNFFKEVINTPIKKRGGFGLSRGFGEFLRALPKEDEWWADEIMDATHAIEKYFREM